MSNQELDNLFRDKLEGFDKKPSRDLWTDIDQKLDSSKKKPIYWMWSIAASVLVLVSIGIWFYSQESKQQPLLATNDVPEISNNKKNTSSKSVEDIERINPKADVSTANPNDNKAVQDVAVKKEVKESSSTKVVKKSTPIIKGVKSSIGKEEPVKTAPKKEEIKTPEVLENDISENIAAIETTDATIEKSPASSTQKGKTLVFDISQFSKEAVAANTDEEVKKDTKLKKLFRFAKDIKEGESGLGELREVKNDLFAFNSRKEENGK